MGQPDRHEKAIKEQAAMAAGAGPSRYFDESRFSEEAPAGSIGSPSDPEVGFCESHDEIAMIRRATEVLGIDHVARWMHSKIPSLGNQIPYALIKTEDGRNQVERVLLKIEHGVY